MKIKTQSGPLTTNMISYQASVLFKIMFVPVNTAPVISRINKMSCYVFTCRHASQRCPVCEGLTYALHVKQYFIKTYWLKALFLDRFFHRKVSKRIHGQSQDNTKLTWRHKHSVVYLSILNVPMTAVLVMHNTCKQ